MVKTPRTRHSKSQRTPVTIELGADDVKRVDEPADEPQVQAEPVESIEVPAQPDSEMRKVEGDPELAGEAVTESAPDSDAERTSGPASDYSFGRIEDSGRTGDAVPPPPSKGSGVSSIAAGLIGAVVALGGFYALQAAGLVGGTGGAAPSLAPVEQELAALKSELATLQSEPADDGVSAALDQLKSEVATLQSAAGSGGAGDAAAVAALDERIKKIESASGGSQGLNDQIAGLDKKITEAADSFSKGEARIAALEQSLSALAAKVEQQASQPKVALAIAAAALKSAVDRGGPFAAEAETFAAIAPSAPQLEALRQYADQGVATEADLLAEFPQAADAMMAAASPENPNAGLIQRLLDSAQSVVKVRPVGAVAGDDPGARIARMEVALKSGDLAKAMAEYDGLPDAVKQAGASLADRIKARIEVTKLVDQLVADAMKSA
ncbi:MAG: phage tail protein [Rhizobiaceae bacterium]|nr:phage tail protein [Rhizobiaceae bacterium]